MNVSVLIVEESENYQNIIKAFLQRNKVNVLAAYTHKEFIDLKPGFIPDIVIISFSTNLSFTRYIISFLQTFYKTTKIALLVSVYDLVTIQELETLKVDGVLRKADESFELLTMLEQVMAGKKYLNY
ncbi:MAG: hypothetical protein ABI675_02825 [Chitinophagaceae bacterium]